MNSYLKNVLITFFLFFLSNSLFAISGGDSTAKLRKIDSSILFSGRQFMMFKDSTFIYLDELTPEEEALLNDNKFTIRGKTFKQDQIRMKYHRSKFTIEDRDGHILSTYINDINIRLPIIEFNGATTVQYSNSNFSKTTTFNLQMFVKNFDYTHIYYDKPNDLLALVADDPESLKEMQICLPKYKKVKTTALLTILGLIIGGAGAMFLVIPLALLAWLCIVGGVATFVIGLIKYNRIRHKIDKDFNYNTVIHNYNVRSTLKKGFLKKR